MFPPIDPAISCPFTHNPFNSATHPWGFCRQSLHSFQLTHLLFRIRLLSTCNRNHLSPDNSVLGRQMPTYALIQSPLLIASFSPSCCHFTVISQCRVGRRGLCSQVWGGLIYQKRLLCYFLQALSVQTCIVLPIVAVFKHSCLSSIVSPSLTHTLARSLTLSLTHSCTHSLMHSLTHALTHSHTHSLTL